MRCARRCTWRRYVAKTLRNMAENGPVSEFANLYAISPFSRNFCPSRKICYISMPGVTTFAEEMPVDWMIWIFLDLMGKFPMAAKVPQDALMTQQHRRGDVRQLHAALSGIDFPFVS